MHGEQNQPYVHARTMVEGVCGVWLVKQVNDAVDDGVDVVDGLPLIPQDVEAHVALVVNVGVVDLHGMEPPKHSDVHMAVATLAESATLLARCVLTLVSQSTFGGSCGYMSGTLILKTKGAPAHKPLSGVTASFMLVKSDGSGHVTLPTVPASSSVISEQRYTSKLR